MFQFAKSCVFGHGPAARRVWFGIGRGCTFVIDPANNSQRILGLGEAEVEADFRRLAVRSRTFVDVGASDGYYPIVALHLNRSLSAVGCEAQAQLAQVARANYRHNFGDGEPRMEWRECFVGDAAGQTPLDEIAADRPGPVFVKIDVEGGELGVLHSGVRLLARPDCGLLLEVHSKDLEVACSDFLAGLGYNCRIVNRAWWRFLVPEFRPTEWNRWVVVERPGSGRTAPN